MVKDSPNLPLGAERPRRHYHAERGKDHVKLIGLTVMFL